MPAYQNGKTIQVAYKVESTFGTAPGAAGATIFRAAPSGGLKLTKALVRPKEFRKDGMSTQVRHGSRSVAGEYVADLTLGTFDALLEAAYRGTWLASFTITQAQMTSITTTTSAIVAAAGSWITQNVRKGDVVRLTNHSTAANNSKNLRVLDVSTTNITVPTGDLVVDAVADATFTLTVLKRLVQADPPVSRSFTFAESMLDIDQDKQFVGCRVTGVTFKFIPDQPIEVTFKLTGQNMSNLSTAASPYYTSPTISTTVPLVVADGILRFNGTDVVDFTSLEVTFDLGGDTQPVIGAVVSPDVFVDNTMGTGSVTCLASDLSRSDIFVNETLISVDIMCVELEAEPKDCIRFFYGNVKFTDEDKPIGGDNAWTTTHPLSIGKDEAGGANTATMGVISTSAP